MATPAASTAARQEAASSHPATTPPRAFATAESQTREQLRAAPLRTLPRPSRLTAGLNSLRGVGPRLAEAAAGADVTTLGDLLLRLPHSYRDRSDVSEAAELRIG